MRIAAVVLGCIVMGTAKAQQMPPIPVDQNVRVGKLDNGLTYYIRHNEYPQNVANFYIAQRVGSINEDESQRGLAHFLEHMAFNGSEHFPGNGLIDYTRTLGVEFGRNLNAYTSFDQTVYRICDVPTAKQSSLDSCLLILKDWSNGLLLEDGEIDKERGVIYQEWQRSASAGQRFYEKHLPDITNHSKYGDRLPIGLMKVVQGFKYKELRDYYHKWYRTDNQAIIVVGNIDVDHTEAEIKKLWGGVTLDPNAAKVETYPINDNDKPVYITFKDKEQTMSVISMVMMHDPTPDSLKKNVDYLIANYATEIICMMLNDRLAEMSQKPEAQFSVGQVGYSSLLGTKVKDAFDVTIVPKEGKNIEALTQVYRELLRASRNGFTATEYERNRTEYLSQIEKAYSNREKKENTEYYNQYVENYLHGEPMPSIEDYYQIMNMLLPNIPVEAINAIVKELIPEGDKNLVVYCMEQEKDGATYTTTKAMQQAVEGVRTETIEAYVDNVKQEPLMASKPKAGKIVSETENKTLGYKKLTLSNGANVILKKTDFKDDEVVMMGYAVGGQALFGEKDYSNLKVFNFAMSSCGLGNFSNTDLGKALAGKQASAGLTLGRNYSYVNCTSTPKDIETMMQLAYLSFTDKRKDDNAWNNINTQLKTVLQNQGLKPESTFADSVAAVTYNHNPRFANLNIKNLDEVDINRIMEMKDEAFKNTGAFTYVIAGNFDEATIRPLICDYIASLPANKEKNTSKDILTYFEGEQNCLFTRKMETPKAQLRNTWRSDNVSYNLKNDIYADAIGQILSMVYLRSIREDAGAAYSVGAYGGMAVRDGKEGVINLSAVCPMDPEKAELCRSLMKKGVEDATTSIAADDVQKVKEYMLKQADLNSRDNSHWLGVIQDYEEYGVDMETDYKNIVSQITPESLSAFLKDVILKGGNHLEILMTPEK